MNDKLRSGMAQALQLTRTGRLVEATTLIQRALQGALAQNAPNRTNEHSAADPIDVSYEVDLAPAESEPRVAERDVKRLDPAEPKPFERLRARLRSFRGRRAGAASTPLSEQARKLIWAGGQFIEGSYTDQAGTRHYKLYIPSGYRGQPLPLVVMLHGCTQTPEDFAVGTRMNVLAEQEGFLVAYPAQAVSANPAQCWNWFKAADQQRDQGEPSLIAGITRQIANTYSTDARRVYIAGLSAGAAMAVIMAMSYPDLYAAAGIHSGLAYGVAHDIPSAFAAMQRGGDGHRPEGPEARCVPTIVFHGDRDTTVHPRNADQVLTQWAAVHASAGGGKKLRITLNRGQIPDGYAYTRSIYHDANGQAVLERWLVHEADHAWSGGHPEGSFTDPKGPDASQAMARFFAQHAQSGV